MKRLLVALVAVLTLACASADQRYGFTGGPFRMTINGHRQARVGIPWRYYLMLKGTMPDLNTYVRFEEYIDGVLRTETEGIIDPTRRVIERHITFPMGFYRARKRTGQTSEFGELPPISDDLEWDESVRVEAKMYWWDAESESWRFLAKAGYNIRLSCPDCAI